MDLPAASWINLALQIPLALVIVFLTIRFLNHLKETTQQMLEFLKQQSDINRSFLESQQKQHNEAISRLAEEIKGNKVDTVRELAALTQRVDAVIDKAIMLERLLPDTPKRK